MRCICVCAEVVSISNKLQPWYFVVFWFLSPADAALEGYNATIFAYGQTSSGKTHSMLGSADDPGVTRRSIQEVFELVRKSTDRQFLLRASYIEIYQEVIRDLLEPSHDNLKIHEDLNRRVYVESREEVVSSVDEVMQMISDGESVRAVGETNMNDRSSRSHTIFTLLIESRAARPSDLGGSEIEGVEPVDDGIAVRASTLSLVDLAGSERATLTGAEGVRLKEGSHINKSLLTLGNVINKLSSAEPGANTAHIPYRDSKLTRILQPALGGNARTAILCAVTPAVMHMEETLSTLKFASRAKKVKNRTQCNEYLDDTAKLRRCERQLVELRKQLAASREGGQHVGPGLSEEALQAAERNRISAFHQIFKQISNTTSTPAQPIVAARWTASSASSRDALDLAFSSVASEENQDLQKSSFDESSESAIASMRRTVFAAEQAKSQMLAEIEYERKAMAAEVETLAQVAEEANKCRAAADDECSEAISALGQAHASSLVCEFIATAMVSAESNCELSKAEKRIEELGDAHGVAEELKKKLSGLERDLSEARKREKRGVGPVLKEVSTLKTKLQDTENKLKSNKQNSSKTSSEKAALEKEVMGKARQIKVLEAEVEKFRKHDGMAQARFEKEVAGVLQKSEEKKAEMDAKISELSSRLEASEQNLSSEKGSSEAMGNKLKDVERVRNELQGLVEEGEIALAGQREAVSKLNGDVSLLTDERDSLKVECARLGEENVKIQKKCEELTSSTECIKKDAEEALQKSAEEIRSLQTEKKNLESLLVEREEQCVRAKADADALGTEVASVHLASERTRVELTLCNEKLEKQATELEKISLSAKLAREEADDQGKAASVSKEKASSVEAQLKEVQSHLDYTQEKLAKAQEFGEAKEKAISVLRQETTSAAEQSQLEFNALSGDLETSRKELAEATNRIAQLSQRISENESAPCKECQKLNEQLADLRRVQTSVGDEAKRLQGEVKSAGKELAAENSRLSSELAKESKKAVSLLETVYSRDERIGDLENKLAEYRRSGGAIRRLELKVERRDATVEQLRSVLGAQKSLIEDGGYGEVGEFAERAVQAEAEVKSLKEESRRQAELVARLEAREHAGQVERRKLRQEIKVRELARAQTRSDRFQGALQERVENT